MFLAYLLLIRSVIIVVTYGTGWSDGARLGCSASREPIKIYFGHFGLKWCKRPGNLYLFLYFTKTQVRFKLIPCRAEEDEHNDSRAQRNRGR
jgi:hypothetical protein